MRPVAFLAVIAFAATLAGQTPPATKGKAAPRFVPSKGTCLLVVGQDKASIDEYASRLKMTPGGVMAYTSVKRLEGLSAPEAAGGATQDAEYILRTYPNSVLQLGLYLVGVVEGVADGSYDANLDKLGDWLKAARRPVYLRVGYEFDLPENKYQPDQYIKAFRRVRDRVEARGASNVAYVWHSYAATNSRTVADWYPGDAYVDWVGVSFFSTKQPHLETVAQFARVKGKPLMVAEATPRGLGTTKGRESWDGWFAPCLAYVKRHDARALCYIDRDWEALPRWQGKGWGDTRIAADPVVRANWLKEVSAPRYLSATDGLFKTLGYVPPPE